MRRYHEPFLGGGAVALGLLGAEPFVRWAGGKRSLASEVIRRLHDPGCGDEEASAPACSCLAFDSYQLSDVNADLVELFRAVRNDVEALVVEVAAMPRTKDFYLALRKSPGSYSRAARAAYLNLFGFNGLWRENKAGQFNVPIDPKRLERLRLDSFFERCREAAKALQSCSIVTVPAQAVIRRLGAGDFAYLDPPYMPDDGEGTATSFTGYARGDDALDDGAKQLELAMLTGEAAARGARVVISNSSAARPLYEAQRTSRVRVDVAEVVGRSSVGAKGDSRGARGEILVTLCPA